MTINNTIKYTEDKNVGDVIQFNHVQLLATRDLDQVTRDGKRTQRQLIRKIHQITRGVNHTEVPHNEIAQFIVGNFTIDGIIDTYNDLGYCGWKEMVTQMVEHEVWERSQG